LSESYRRFFDANYGMGARLSNFVSQLLEILPRSSAFLAERGGTSPVAGSRYRVRSRTTADAVILPLGSTSPRVRVSLPPKATLWIHAATRSEDEHVYALAESPDVTELMPMEERALARARGYLLEVSRHDLRAHYVRS
jgi:hypothetical protein